MHFRHIFFHRLLPIAFECIVEECIFTLHMILFVCIDIEMHYTTFLCIHKFESIWMHHNTFDSLPLLISWRRVCMCLDVLECMLR